MKINKYLNNYKYELIILLLLIFELVMYIPKSNGMFDWCTTPYLFSYKYGLKSKFLIGSIIDIIHPYLSYRVVYYLILLSLLFIILLVSIYFGKIIRISEQNQKKGMIILAAVYLASPASISYLFYWGNYGRLDTYLLALVLITVYIITKKPKLLFIVPIICIIGIAIHQVFIFTYFIPILCFLLYDTYENSFSKKNVAILILSIIFTLISFIYFQFFTPELQYASSSEFVDILSQKTSAPISKDMIELEYFTSIKDQITDVVMPNLFRRILKGILILVLLMPVIIILAIIWKKAIKYTTDKKLKMVLYAMIISPLAILPALMLTVDWGRWFAAALIVQFCYIFYLYYRKCKPMLHSLLLFNELLEKWHYIPCFLLIYLSYLGKFEAANQLEIVNRIIKLFG